MSWRYFADAGIVRGAAASPSEDRRPPDAFFETFFAGVLACFVAVCFFDTGFFVAAFFDGGFEAAAFLVALAAFVDLPAAFFAPALAGAFFTALSLAAPFAAFFLAAPLAVDLDAAFFVVAFFAATFLVTLPWLSVVLCLVPVHVSGGRRTLRMVGTHRL